MPSESSEKLYQSQIISYFNKSKFSPQDDFLKKHKEVLEELEQLYPNINTRKNIINSLIIYGRKIDFPEKFLAYYGIAIDKLNSMLKSKIQTNEKTEKQAENWLTASEIKKVIEDLRKEIPTNISTYRQYRSLMAFLAVFLQFNFPRRNDWATMKLVTSTPKDEDFNYMVMGGSYANSKFIFNKYKTVAKMGSQIFDMPETIFYTVKALKQHILNFAKDGYIFIRKDGEPLNSNEFTKFFIKTMQDKTGKKVGSSLIRHIVITDKFSMDPNELRKREELANQMGHSIMQQMQYSKTN